MAQASRRHGSLELLLLIVSLGHAQKLTNLPTLSTGANSSPTTNRNGATNTISHLTGLPTLAGASIPTLVIPYTANAPFMQKSSLPEGTFFIAVGASLAFLVACVLLWRGLVAWSVNRSVKRSANTSVGAYSEKTGPTSVHSGWGGSRKSSGYNPVSKPTSARSDAYSVSTDNLTSVGKPTKHGYRDSVTERPTAPPQDLFFSPTAQPRESVVSKHRSSTYMPSGFYASPSAQPAGGAATTTVGTKPDRYTQHHKRSSTQATLISRPSPPISPSAGPRAAAHSRDNSRAALTRDYFGDTRGGPRNTQLYPNASASSLMVGQSSVGGESSRSSRPPSTYLEDMMDGRGSRPQHHFR